MSSESSRETKWFSPKIETNRPFVKEAGLAEDTRYPPSPFPSVSCPPLPAPPLPWILILSGIRVFLIFHGLQAHKIRGDFLHLYTGGPCQAFDVFYNSVLYMVQVLRVEKRREIES